MNFLKKLFGKKEQKAKYSREDYDRAYALKSAGLERVLGPSHAMVGHAIIPFDIGGTVDMYYYLKGIKGTGFATMELIQPDGTGPLPNEVGTYELVGFSKHDYDTAEGDTPFNLIERRLCWIFTRVGNFSSDAKLKPRDTCELPEDGQPNTCLVFDEYNPDGIEFFIGNKKHGLLLVMELFPGEMEYAREYGSAGLIKKLKEAGHYPYSDLDRDPVV
jgi:hypothetical protein